MRPATPFTGSVGVAVAAPVRVGAGVRVEVGTAGLPAGVKVAGEVGTPVGVGVQVGSAVQLGVGDGWPG